MIRTDSLVRTKDTLTRHHIKWLSAQKPFILDSAYFPTLAHRRHWAEINQNEGHWTCVVGDGVTPPANGQYSGLIVHLAYQQGKLDSIASQYIMHNMIACSLGAPMQKPVFWVSPTEHVSAGLPGCGFLHPSIAVDSLSVAVAFQSHSYVSRRPTLRFRDSDTVTSEYTGWSARTYTWGSKGEYNEWPSLTMFPAARVSDLRNTILGDTTYKGAIVWYRTNAPSNVATQQLYRFGATYPQPITNGQFPTMTLVAGREKLYYDATSVLFRGDTTRLDSLIPRPTFGYRYYYPAMLENGPLTRLSYLKTSGVTTNVMPQANIGGEPDYSAGCPRMTGILIGVRIPIKLPMAELPGLPPSFFTIGTDGAGVVRTLADVEEITRTGTFESGLLPAVIVRHVSRASDAVAWLNTQPYDSSLGSLADVRVVTELVRVSDSTVIWSDDTISVRAVTADTLETAVELPTHLLTPGTEVFARVRMIPTSGMVYELNGGFAWEPDAAAFSLKGERWTPRSAPAVAEPGASLGMLIVPNPARDRATIIIETRQPAEISVSLVDALGRIVRRYPTLSTARAGQHTLPIALDGIPNGLYLVRAEAEGTASVSKTLIVAP
jgi:hypothetical protein